MTREDSSTAHRGLRLSGDRFFSFRRRPRVMGILNITPDSFSDGGLFLEPQKAVDRALEMIDEGAELLDLGAESTRPGGGVYGGGARDVPAREEIERLLPVLEALRPRVDVPLSVDTRKGAVARRALDAGADLINDISMIADDELAQVVADTGCPVIAMHSRGSLSTMQRGIRFTDVVAEVRDELKDVAHRLVQRGVAQEQIVLDPGIGFGKTAAQNLALIRGLPRLAELGHPLLLGASRKSFIADTVAGPGTGADASGPPPAQRVPGSLAAAAWAAAHGTEILRVHDVAATVQFLDVWSAVESAAVENAA